MEMLGILIMLSMFGIMAFVIAILLVIYFILAAQYKKTPYYIQTK